MGVCNCSMFCCTLLYVHSSIAIILMGKRELIALLNLSSWCLVMVERLFLAVPRGCLQFVIVVFPDHTHILLLGVNMSYNMRHALNTMFCLLSVSWLLVNCFYLHTTVMLTVCYINRQPGRGYHYSETNACGESASSKKTHLSRGNRGGLSLKYFSGQIFKTFASRGPCSGNSAQYRFYTN